MKKSVFFSIIATLSMLIVLMLFIAFIEISVQLDALDDIDIISPDLAIVSDGTYIGHYEIFPLSVEVEVTLIDHHYTEIVIVGHSIFFDQNASLMITHILSIQDLDIELTDEREDSEKILLLAIMDAIENQDSVDMIT